MQNGALLMGVRDNNNAQHNSFTYDSTSQGVSESYLLASEALRLFFCPSVLFWIDLIRRQDH
jgi:hypothetical protein